MEKRKFDVRSVEVAVGLLCVVVLLVVPLTRVVSMLSSCVSGSYKKRVVTEEWRMVDEASGVKEDLVAFSIFCKKNIPAYTNTLFFMPYSYYRTRYATEYAFAYIPYRMRFYLYPVKVWWFKDRYKNIVRQWGHVSPDSKKRLLSGFEFIIGFALDARDFPGFAEYRCSDGGGIILKRK